MKRFGAALIVAVALAFVGVFARAAEPAHTTFAPAPPGIVMQNELGYLAGDAMHSQWRTVLSRKIVGASHGRTFYQYYLSIYAIDGDVYELKYQSPRDGGPFSVVSKAHGAAMWFPVQDGKIVGVGSFMGPGADQVVVQSHEMAADCGSARVDVFYSDAAMHGMIMPTLTVKNGCDLQAKILHHDGADALQLTGPYYAKDAALCCPTKPKASSTLHFVNGKGVWSQTPSYFTISKSP